jgi:hypothetical protein
MQRSDDPNVRRRPGGGTLGRPGVRLSAAGVAILLALFAGAGSATSALNAPHGAPFTIKPPAPVLLNHGYGVPIDWSWKCTANSRLTPWILTVRWEVAPPWNGGPTSPTGGSPPFRFMHAQAFTVKVGDACDHSPGSGFVKRLSKDVKLLVQIGGSVSAGGGGLALTQVGGFRNHDPKLGPIDEAQAFHLELTITQGKRTLLDTKLCSYSQAGFDLVEKGVFCWE